MAIKHWSATPLPDNVSYQAGAVATDACMTAYHAVVGTGGVQVGETVLIIGIGGLGFNGMQIAKARGARVIVRDNRKEVLEEAKKFGIADDDIVPAEKKLDEWVKEKGLLVDTVVDFAGKEETFEAAQNAGESLPTVSGREFRSLTNLQFVSVAKWCRLGCSPLKSRSTTFLLSESISRSCAVMAAR
jgi:D-arabinose 1-dehydrogenase-like Zn-dependent alcohol dehydrogenase